MKKTKATENDSLNCGLEAYEKSKDYQVYNKQFEIIEPEKIGRKIDSKLSDYIPHQNTPLKIICVNYHIFQDDTGQ